MAKKEKEELYEKMRHIHFDPNRLRIKFASTSDKYIQGCVSPKGSKDPYAKYFKYQTLYETICDLDLKIKYSFTIAIERAYSEEVSENFCMVSSSNEEEMFIYYFIENAVLRINILWDMLAQIYNLFYDVDIKPHRIHYKKMFSPNEKSCERFYAKAKEIHSYIEEEDFRLNGFDFSGNHKYINNFRNKMLHRNTPTVATFSDYDFNFKECPIYIIQRAMQDYCMVSYYLLEIVDKIEKVELPEFA